VPEEVRPGGSENTMVGRGADGQTPAKVSMPWLGCGSLHSASKY